jgi:hypothetical protein
MKTQDKFVFILTFLTGLAAGMYIYVISFKPTYAPETIDPNEELAQDFSVIGKQYGGDLQSDYVAPSFRITGNGNFDYRPGGNSESALEPVSGQLPNSLVSEIKDLATKGELEFLVQPRAESDCRSHVDGFDYQYRVILEGIEYHLDSCNTLLGYNSELAVALEDVWDYLNDPTSNNEETLFGDSFYDTSVNFIRENLSPYEN